MKKLILITISFFGIISANAQYIEDDYVIAHDAITLGDSSVTVFYQDTLTNPAFVRSYVSAALAAGVTPDSSFTWASADTLKTFIVYFDTVNDGYTNIKGGLVWDTTHQTLTIFNGNGSSTQIGQEQNIYVHNVSGTSISAGDPIYIIPHNSDEIRVGLASNLNAVTAYGCIGIATTDIPNGGTGRVCSFGLVHDLNTDSWTEGAYLWLGDGVLQQTKPTSGHLVVVGQNLRKSATEGIIGVKVSFNSSRQYAVLTTDGMSGTYIDSTSITVDSLIADSVFTTSITTDSILNNSQINLSTGNGFYYFNDSSFSFYTQSYDGNYYSEDGSFLNGENSSKSWEINGPTKSTKLSLKTDKVTFQVGRSTGDYDYYLRDTSFYIMDHSGTDTIFIVQNNTLTVDTITAIKGKFDTIEFANGAKITDTISLKAAVEAEVFDTVAMGVLVADSIRILRYKGRQYTDAGVAITISIANTYYTINGLTTGHAENITVTDSSITIPKDGWYGLFMHCSGHCSTNGRSPHISLFVDDIEDTRFEAETRHATSGENYMTVWGGERYCTAGEVLKVKVKYLANTGTYTIDHFGFDVGYNP